jgi:hypothetical protein
LDGLFEPKEDKYIATLVTTGTKDRSNVHFCDDWRKSRAYVFTDESSSGKSWFAKQSLRRQTNLEEAAFIYKEIGDEDARKFKSLSGSFRIIFFF